MGILNVTPDSFSDGGMYSTVDSAVAHALQLEKEGAAYVDVGGESTRPGALPVTLEEECDRVIPVIKSLNSKLNVPISIDTRNAMVALRACEAGATMINDVSAGSDPEMFDVAKHTKSDIVLMHMQGTPETMQQNPNYKSVVDEVLTFLSKRAEFGVTQGIPKERIWIDPGIGFGKTVDDNYKLLQKIDSLTELPFRVLVGHSRKSFMNDGEACQPSDRTGGSLAIALWCAEKAVSMVRMHDVQTTLHALKISEKLKGGN